MSETCPLLEGSEGITGIPKFCRERCEIRWMGAAAVERGFHTDYDHLDEINACPHKESQHGQASLEVGRNPVIRHYSVVEECNSCGEELGKDLFTFVCPASP